MSLHGKQLRTLGLFVFFYDSICVIVYHAFVLQGEVNNVC